MSDISQVEFEIAEIVRFYRPYLARPDACAPQTILTDATVEQSDHLHVVSAARWVIICAELMRYDRKGGYDELARARGRDFLRQYVAPDFSLIQWEFRGGEPVDRLQRMYGWAFAIMAMASLVRAGHSEFTSSLERLMARADQMFWLPKDQLFADEYFPGESTARNYRGQNANMHACEAWIVSYEATGRVAHLDRAITIARRICCDLACPRTGWIAEHYDQQWQIDWEYHKDQPKDLYRPWGFQVGHQLEWVKLLAKLAGHRQESWQLQRAGELMRSGFDRGWDPKHRGLVYGLDRALQIVDGDKHFWVQAESMAAAALLWHATGSTEFLYFYDNLWAIIRERFVDRQHGAWHRIFSRDFRERDPYKALPGAKIDYHTLLACLDARQAFLLRPRN